MFKWINRLFQGTEQSTVARPTDEPLEVYSVKASVYASNDIGEALWSEDHNGDRLTVSGKGRTIEWDFSKDNEGEMTPCWIPASTRCSFIAVNSASVSTSRRWQNVRLV